MGAALLAYGLKLRQSRGQHFLVSHRVLGRILDAAEPGPGDLILEAGAGIGTLTTALAKTGAAVVAVEVDGRFIPLLRAVCAPFPHVKIVYADAMRLDPAALPSPPTKVVANLPYSIASPLLISLLETSAAHRYVVMVQEEVARRITARPGTGAFGLLSVAVQAHAVATTVMRVPPSAFYPSPQVRSAVVRLDVPDDPRVAPALVPAVMAVARAAFSQRRKMLRSALQMVGSLRRPPGLVDAICREAGIDPRRRGESLSVAEFEHLARAFADRGRGSE